MRYNKKVWTRCLNAFRPFYIYRGESTQIIDDLVNNKAEFIINKADKSISKMMINDIGTDTEITYKLVSQQFGLEFYLEK